MKICTACEVTLELSNFHKKKNGKYGVRAVCKSCSSADRKQKWINLSPEVKATRYAKQLAWNRVNPEKVREGKIWTMYRLRPTDYADLFEKQGGRCAICGILQEETKTFHIDHDRACCPSPMTCGKCVRGLLCGLCNHGLGQFKESIPSMEKAIKYLSKH